MNKNCVGFQQVDNSVLIGGQLAGISVTGGTQYWLRLAWIKYGADWWLLWGGTTWVGYYPGTLYTHGMQNQADTVQFGGEVYNSEPSGRHTTTDMGSGEFASQGYRNAAFQGGVLYIPTVTPLNGVDVAPTGALLADPACYSLSTGYETQNGNDATTGAHAVPMNGYFEYFGGPGYSSNCR